MQKIIPSLWFNKKADEAVNFYLSAFSEGKKSATYYYPKEGLADFQTEFAGQVLTIDFELLGYRFIAINAGSEFSPNPAISFMVNFDPSIDNQAQKNLDQLWEKLIVGGKVLMPLDTYPFSKHYGWVEDKYGISWQLILTDPAGQPRPQIIPSLMFVTSSSDTAEQATEFYLSLFKNSKRGLLVRYPAGLEPNKQGSVMFTDFVLENQWFTAIDASASQHQFSFNEAISLLINCKNQTEIDYYWDKLTSDGGQESVCGWLKDKFGISWQVAPQAIDELVQNPKAFAKMMQMKKIIISDLNNT